MSLSCRVASLEQARCLNFMLSLSLLPVQKSPTLWKLYSDIVKICKENGVVKSAKSESAELKLIWQKCGIENTVLSSTSCQVLLELVCNKSVEFNYVYQGLINIVPSAKSLYSIVTALKELITIQALDKETTTIKYSCPFSIRNPTHPFILVLTNRPECWNVVTQQVYSLYHHPNTSVQNVATRILKPFIQFLFLEPQQTAAYQPMRNGLLDVLLGACHKTDVTNDVIGLLVEILPGIQVKSSEHLSHFLQFLTQLVHQISTQRCCLTDEETIGGLVTVGLTVIKPSLKNSLSVTTLLQQILILLQKCKTVCITENIIIILSDLLMIVDADVAEILLSLCKIILEKGQERTNNIIQCILVLPLVQIYSMPAEQPNSNKVRNLAAGLLNTIEDYRNNKITSFKNTITKSVTSEGFESQLVVNLVGDIHDDKKSLLVFLNNLKNSLDNIKTLLFTTTNLVAAILLTSRDFELTKHCLTLLVEIAKKDNSQSPNFLPLLLYQLGHVTDVDTRLLILEHLPLLARHKVCIGPILKTIQMLSSSIKLRPLAIRLMVNLWQLQDRCFPQLMKLLSDGSTNNDVIIAQAVAIKEICHLRPEQHGGDLLAPVSDILNKCTSIEMGCAAALALEALYMMCEAEVIDIQSAWRVLAAKLSTDTRPVVIEKICDLFALVPNLAINTPEYQEFQGNIVNKLWTYSQNTDTRIQGAAYQALASFSINDFYIEQLPSQITEDIRLDLEKKKKNKEEEKEINLHIPVSSTCYTRLLLSVNTQVLKDYGVFLSGIVGKEVSDLPRGIYHSSLRRQNAVSNQGKAIGSIPAFILSEYEKTRQPGLRPSLAVSLLFCYDPPIEVGRDGRPRRHYVISHGKNYQQMFETLLHEIPIQPSEWHRCMLLPQGWTSFTDRLYSSMLESRKVEIELQVRQAQIEDDEAKNKISVNWLWIRDLLTDVIKKTSKQNPSMQGNSVLALAGLAVAVNRHVRGLDKDEVKSSEDVGQHMSHSHWLMVVMDTIMSIMDVKFKSKGEILNMCFQGDMSDRKQATLLARTSSCMALAQLVPVMMSCDTDRIHDIIVKLTNGLPGQSACDEAPVSQFHYGLALGMLTGRLFEEHFADICGTKGMTELWKGLTILEDTCLNAALDNRSGCILGLGLSISGLCQEGKTDSRVHVTDILEKIINLFKVTDVNDKSYQAIGVCMACICGSAFNNNIISAQTVDLVVELLHLKHTENTQISGICLALGMICYSLTSIGYSSIENLRDKLLKTWLTTVTTQESAPMEKVSMLNGLLAMVGSERTLIPVSSSSRVTGAESSTNEIVKMASKMVTISNDIGIQGNAAWMLGHLYLSACAVTETRASVPPNYGYLKETSVLRAMVEFLLEAGKFGPEKINNQELKIVLNSLQDEVSRLLPPLNWTGVLSPLMRLDYEPSVKCICLKLGASQCLSSPTAVTFISTWLSPPLFNTLTDDCKSLLYRSLPMLIKSVPSSTLKIFLEKSCLEAFTSGSNNTSQCVAVLEGLNKALLVQDPPKAVTSLIYQATERFYKNITTMTSVPVLCNISKCLCSIPDNLFDLWTAEDFTNHTSFIKGVFIRCQLIALGRQPITILNSCLDATVNNENCDYIKVFSIVCHCFYGTVTSKAEMTGPMMLLQWLLELIGHIRNIAVGVVQLDENSFALKQVLEFLVAIVSAAISIWTRPSVGCMIGINPNMVINDIDCLIEDNINIGSVCLNQCLQSLPATISNLKTEPWLQILPKIINWMLCLLQLPSDLISQSVYKSLKESLYILKHCEEFRKASVWTQVFTLQQVN